jgi:hypothetical protein
MRGLSLVLLCIVFSAIAFAEEPRWCSVSSRDPSNTITYAPIAAAAQIQGEVRARIIYRPNGRVEKVEPVSSKVEPVSGTKILLAWLTDELPNWTVRTNASGDEPCQTLVIATFTLQEPRSRKWKSKVKFTTEPNTIHIYISRHWPELNE